MRSYRIADIEGFSVLYPEALTLRTRRSCSVGILSDLPKLW